MNSPSDPHRILIVVTHPLGGIRNYLLYNLQKIAMNGYRFGFVAPAGDSFEKFKSDVRSWPEVELFNVDQGKSIRKATRQILNTRRYSLIHSQGLRAGTESALANVGLGVPHIMTLHDVIVPQNQIPGRLKRLKQLVVGQITKRINVIVPVSNDCAENHLQKFPCWQKGPCQIDVIPNGVDLSRLSPHTEVEPKGLRLRPQFAIGREVCLAGFFGRFMPQKGFTVLLEALKELAGRGYEETLRVVATEDRNGYGREYHNLVESDSVLNKMVRFIDPVTNISSVLSQVDLLVMPSLWEAYGLLAAEAMVLGIPVVGSDAIGLREVLHGTSAKMPSAGDAVALADAISSAMNPCARQAAQAYRSLAISRFDNSKSALKLHDLYDRFCARSHIDHVRARAHATV